MADRLATPTTDPTNTPVGPGRTPDGVDVERVVRRFWALGGEEIALDGGVLVRHADCADQLWGTFLSQVRTPTPGALENLLAACEDLLDGGCRRIVLDRATPPAVEAHLALEEWRAEPLLQLVLPAGTAVPPAQRTLHPLRTDQDWDRVRELFRLDHVETDELLGRRTRPEASTAAAAALRRSLCPPAEYFAVHGDSGDGDSGDGGFIGFIGCWRDGGVGLVEDVYVRPPARRHGVAGDMLRFAVGRLRGAGAGPVVIGADVNDTPKHLYARFGFRPATVTRSWVRRT